MLWSLSHPNLAREKVKCFPSTLCRKPCHHPSEKFNYPVVSSPVLTPCSCPSPIPFPHNVVYWVICVIVPVRKALKIVHLIQHKAFINCSLGWGQLGKSGPRSQGMVPFLGRGSRNARVPSPWAHTGLTHHTALGASFNPAKPRKAAPVWGFLLPSSHPTYPRLRS